MALDEKECYNVKKYILIKPKDPMPDYPPPPHPPVFPAYIFGHLGILEMLHCEKNVHILKRFRSLDNNHSKTSKTN